MTSTSLALVPGVVKDAVHAEPAVTARLDNIEKMMEKLAQGFSEMKKDQKKEWPEIQVNGTPVGAGGASGGHQQPGGQVGEHSFGGARSKAEYAKLPIGGLGLRARSDSRKRKAEEERVLQQRQQQQVQSQGAEQGQQGWNHVVAGGRGRRRPVQYGTSQKS